MEADGKSYLTQLLDVDAPSGLTSDYLWRTNTAATDIEQFDPTSDWLTQYHTDARGDARYYLKTEVDNALLGKSDVGHNHDDRYYTIAELDNGQLDSRYSTTSEIVSALLNYSLVDGSRAFTGDVTMNAGLIVDTDTLVVDAVNNRIGINNASPSYDLDVIGTVRSTRLRSSNLQVVSNQIQENITNNNASVYINFAGYNEGYTQYRDLNIGDGRGNILTLFDGSTGLTTIFKLSIASAYTFPIVDGANTYVMQTDGSGVLSWVANAGGGGGVTNPPSVKGDIWSYDTGTNKFPVGSDGYPLVPDSTTSFGLKYGTNTLNLGDSGAVADTTINFLSSGNSTSITWDQSAKYLDFTDGIRYSALPERFDGNSLFNFGPSYGTLAPIIGVIDCSPTFNNITIADPSGFGGSVRIRGSSWSSARTVYGFNYGITGESSVTVGSSTNLSVVAGRLGAVGVGASGTMNVKEATSLLIQHNSALSGTAGTFNADDIFGIRVEDLSLGVVTLNITNMYQMRLAKPTKGTSNYQGVLLGNGPGSGLWFNGTGGQRLYSDGTDLLLANGSFQGTYNSNDGTAGATGSIPSTFTSIIVKNGLITGWV